MRNLLVICIFAFCNISVSYCSNKIETNNQNDSVLAEVKYQLTFKKDKQYSSNEYSTDTVILHINSHGSHSFSLKENELSKNLHERFLRNGKRWTNMNNWYAYIGEVYNDFNNKRQKVNLLLDAAGVFSYEERLPTIKWNIDSENKKLIQDYMCVHATCNYRGRTFSAWFCPEIPFKAGPWELYGLPGLILEVSDELNDYIFKCVSINKKSQDSYVIDDSYIKKTNRAKAQKMLKYLCKKPGTFLSGYGIKVSVEGVSGDIMGYDCNPIGLK